MACVGITEELNPCGLKHTGDCSGLVHNPIKNSKQSGISSSLRTNEKKVLSMFKIHENSGFNTKNKNINPSTINSYDVYLAKKKGKLLRNQYKLNYLNQDKEGSDTPDNASCDCNNNTTFNY